MNNTARHTNILHLSDLHFGAINPEVLIPLIDKIHKLSPSLIVVSGDITQRARKQQFKAAQDFLMQLPYPQIVVPGNHDVPLYNLFARFFHPLQSFKKYISMESYPLFINEDVLVIGINSTKSFTFKHGTIRKS